MPNRRAVTAVALVAAFLPVAGCESGRHRPANATIQSLIAESRPIGPGARFQPRGRRVPIPTCRRGLGRRSGVHVEVFAANKVVLLPGGIGAEPPLGYTSGRISSARCYGAIVTIDPTGLVLVRQGIRLTLSALFRTWGEPLSSTRVASFSTHAPVAVFVNGPPWHGDPRNVGLSPHAEIVLEVGTYVPPHSTYQFPPGT